MGLGRENEGRTRGKILEIQVGISIILLRWFKGMD
jgi:hypothetical protein